MPMREFLDWVNWGGETLPKCGWHHPTSWRHRLNKKERTSGVIAIIFLLPKHVHHVTRWLTLLPQWISAMSCTLALGARINPSFPKLLQAGILLSLWENYDITILETQRNRQWSLSSEGGAQSSWGGSQDPDEHSQFKRERASEGVNKTCLPDSVPERSRSGPLGAQIFGKDLMVYAIPPGYHNHRPKSSRVDSFVWY